MDEDGRWLEEEIADYMKYRLPELGGVRKRTSEGSGTGEKSGGISALCTIPAVGGGRLCADLKKKGQEIEKSLRTMEETREKLCAAADEERTAVF